MSRRIIAVVFLLVCGTLCVHAEPANVFRADGSCSTGWFGCTSDVGVILPDGSWTCPADQIGLIFIEGDGRRVESNSEHENLNSRCDSDIVFNQPNPGGALGGGVEVIALSFDTVCTFLADACQGQGAFVGNPRTIGSLAVCGTPNGPTTNMQEVVSRSGQTSLVCSLPDPPQGE